MKPVAFATIVALVSVAPSTADEPEDPVESFYQRVDIKRSPRFVIQGMNVSQQVHYRILSSFDVYAPDETGKRRAIQTVKDATLIEADPLSQAVFTQSLATMLGRKFTYKIDKFSEIVSMEGHQDNTAAVEVQRPKSIGVLVSTVIDEDGWKELAQLTLFQPPERGRSARSFNRRTTHDWGSLGSWYGQTTFTGRASGRNVKRFRYTHQLEYIPPDKDAPQANDDLPFEIDSADFRAYEAWGEIDYSKKLERVISVREVFHARGAIVASVLGTPTTVDVEEKQTFEITVTGPRLLKINSSQQAGSRSPNEP